MNFTKHITYLTSNGVKDNPDSWWDKFAPTSFIETTPLPPAVVPMLILYVTFRCGCANPNHRAAILVVDVWKSTSSMSLKNQIRIRFKTWQFHNLERSYNVLFLKQLTLNSTINYFTKLTISKQLLIKVLVDYFSYHVK